MKDQEQSKKGQGDFQKKTLYLDWNVFNKLEHLDELKDQDRKHYGLLALLLVKGLFIAPYSNAHISDLARGFEKDPSYTPGHIAHLGLYTNNLCMAQYWGESCIRWHRRDPLEFLTAVIQERKEISPTFGELFSTLDEPLLQQAFELRKLTLRMTPVPPAFKQIYSVNPIFQSMYPRTRTEMNQLALCEDIYGFSQKIRTDFVLYRHFRKFLVDTKNRFPQYRDLFRETDAKMVDVPKYLNWDQMWDDLEPDFAPTSNARYDQLMHLFTTTDLKGYRQDEKFANLIDDALHCFYGAHCDYFITLDSKCYDKAKLVYQKLKVSAQVLTPREFFENFSAGPPPVA